MTQQTERECSNCGDNYVKGEYETFCPNCGYTPTGTEFTSDDPWQEFWDERDNYSGTYGSDRKRCVGGFTGVWFDENGEFDP